MSHDSRFMANWNLPSIPTHTNVSFNINSFTVENVYSNNLVKLLLTSATAVHRISSWFLIVHLVKMLIYLPKIHLTEGVGRLGPQTWFKPPKPSLQCGALCGTVCALSIAIILCLIDLLLACWFYFIFLII